jgi:hypothetical protein
MFFLAVSALGTTCRNMPGTYQMTHLAGGPVSLDACAETLLQLHVHMQVRVSCSGISN